MMRLLMATGWICSTATTLCFGADAQSIAAGQGLPLIVQNEQGKRFLIQFQKDWALEELKKSIATGLNLPGGTKFRVLFEHNELSDLTNLPDYSLVEIAIDEIQIFIVAPSGRTTELDNIDAKIGVEELKAIISKIEGISSGQIRLIFAGRQLSEDKTIADYGILGNHTLHFSMRLKGD